MSKSSRDGTLTREKVLGTTRGILTVDSERRIVFANEPIAEILGEGPDDVVGTELDESLGTPPDIIDTTPVGGQQHTTLNIRGADRVTTVTPFEQDGEQFWTLTIGPEQSEIEHTRDKTPLRQLLDRSRESHFIFDAEEATVVDCNQQARNLLPEDTFQSQPVRELVATPAVFISFLEDVLEADEGRREEFGWRTGDGETRAVEVDATPLETDGERIVFARARDVSDRNQLQTQRRRRTAALDTVREGVGILDSTFDHSYVNESYAELLGDIERGDPLGQYLADESRLHGEIRPAIEQDGRWRGTIGGKGTVVEALFEELEDGSVVAVLSEPRPNAEEPGARLTELDETCRQLATADDIETVVQMCLDTIRDVFEYELGCLWLTKENNLQIAGATRTARDLVENNPGFELGRSTAGRVYRTGESLVQTETETAVADLLSSSAHFPIGDHGVLTVATTDEWSIDPRELESLHLLALSVETVLDNIELASEQRQPETTDDSFIQGLFSDLVTAENRSAVEEVVCESLAGADRYNGGWIAGVNATGERLRLREQASLPADCLPNDRCLGAFADGTVETALEAGEVTILEPATVFPETDIAAADICVIPFVEGDKLFGCLFVHSEHPLEPVDRRRFEVLGDSVGFMLSAHENEKLLLSDEFVQLEFQVTDPSCLSVALSDELDTSVSMKRTVKNANDEHLSYVRIEDTSTERAVEATESIDSVRDCRVINDYDYGCLLEVKRDSSGVEVMLEFGATMRNAEAESGLGTLVLEAPHTADIRRIVDAYQSYNPESELLTKRRIDRPVRAADQLRADIEDELTEKQLSAVSSAYFSGYYEWPRESTAEEIADSMGVSASTLHQHIRHAHQKLLASVLEKSFSRRL